jgi:hypothetical protein
VLEADDLDAGEELLDGLRLGAEEVGGEAAVVGEDPRERRSVSSGEVPGNASARFPATSLRRRRSTSR